MGERMEQAEQQVQESAQRRARLEQMSDMRSVTPGRMSTDFRSPSPLGRASRMGGGYKSASAGDLLDIEDLSGE